MCYFCYIYVMSWNDPKVEVTWDAVSNIIIISSNSLQMSEMDRPIQKSENWELTQSKPNKPELLSFLENMFTFGTYDSSATWNPKRWILNKCPVWFG